MMDFYFKVLVINEYNISIEHRKVEAMLHYLKYNVVREEDFEESDYRDENKYWFYRTIGVAKRKKMLMEVVTLFEYYIKWNYLNSKLIVAREQFETGPFDPNSVLPEIGIGQIGTGHAELGEAHEEESQEIGLMKVDRDEVRFKRIMECLKKIFLLIGNNPEFFGQSNKQRRKPYYMINDVVKRIYSLINTVFESTKKRTSDDLDLLRLIFSLPKKGIKTTWVGMNYSPFLFPKNIDYWAYHVSLDAPITQFLRHVLTLEPDLFFSFEGEATDPQFTLLDSFSHTVLTVISKTSSPIICFSQTIPTLLSFLQRIISNQNDNNVKKYLIQFCDRDATRIIKALLRYFDDISPRGQQFGDSLHSKRENLIVLKALSQAHLASGIHSFCSFLLELIRLPFYDFSTTLRFDKLMLDDMIYFLGRSFKLLQFQSFKKIEAPALSIIQLSEIIHHVGSIVLELKNNNNNNRNNNIEHFKCLESSIRASRTEEMNKLMKKKYYSDNSDERVDILCFFRDQNKELIELAKSLVQVPIDLSKIKSENNNNNNNIINKYIKNLENLSQTPRASPKRVKYQCFVSLAFFDPFLRRFGFPKNIDRDFETKFDLSMLPIENSRLDSSEHSPVLVELPEEEIIINNNNNSDKSVPIHLIKDFTGSLLKITEIFGGVEEIVVFFEEFAQCLVFHDISLIKFRNHLIESLQENESNQLEKQKKFEEEKRLLISSFQKICTPSNPFSDLVMAIVEPLGRQKSFCDKRVLSALMKSAKNDFLERRFIDCIPRIFFNLETEKEQIEIMDEVCAFVIKFLEDGEPRRELVYFLKRLVCFPVFCDVATSDRVQEIMRRLLMILESNESLLYLRGSIVEVIYFLFKRMRNELIDDVISWNVLNSVVQLLRIHGDDGEVVDPLIGTVREFYFSIIITFWERKCKLFCEMDYTNLKFILKECLKWRMRWLKEGVAEKFSLGVEYGRVIGGVFKDLFISFLKLLASKCLEKVEDGWGGEKLYDFLINCKGFVSLFWELPSSKDRPEVVEGKKEKTLMIEELARVGKALGRAGGREGLVKVLSQTMEKEEVLGDFECKFEVFNTNFDSEFDGKILSVKKDSSEKADADTPQSTFSPYSGDDVKDFVFKIELTPDDVNDGTFNFFGGSGSAKEEEEIPPPLLLPRPSTSPIEKKKEEDDFGFDEFWSSSEKRREEKEKKDTKEDSNPKKKDEDDDDVFVF